MPRKIDTQININIISECRFESVHIGILGGTGNDDLIRLWEMTLLPEGAAVGRLKRHPMRIQVHVDEG